LGAYTSIYLDRSGELIKNRPFTGIVQLIGKRALLVNQIIKITYLKGWQNQKSS